MVTKINKERSIGYYDTYDIEINTTKKLSSEEYKIITTAIESISAVFDSYLDTKLEEKKKEELVQGSTK